MKPGSLVNHSSTISRKITKEMISWRLHRDKQRCTCQTHTVLYSIFSARWLFVTHSLPHKSIQQYIQYIHRVDSLLPYCKPTLWALVLCTPPAGPWPRPPLFLCCLLWNAQLNGSCKGIERECWRATLTNSQQNMHFFSPRAASQLGLYGKQC